MSKLFYRILNFVDSGLKVTVGMVTLGMALLIVCDAMGRAINHPIPGAVEITEEYLMVAIVFLGMGFTQREGRHIKVELFEKWIPQLYAPLLRALINGTALIYFGLMGWFALSNTFYAFSIDKRSISELAYPLAYAYLLVVIGSAIICVWLAIELFGTFSRKKG